MVVLLLLVAATPRLSKGTSQHATKALRNSEGISPVHKHLPTKASAEQSGFCEAEVYDEQRRLHAYESKPETS